LGTPEQHSTVEKVCILSTTIIKKYWLKSSENEGIEISAHDAFLLQAVLIPDSEQMSTIEL
jgi:hypothetical protein